VKLAREIGYLVCTAITSYRLAVKQDNKVNNGHANERLKGKLEGTAQLFITRQVMKR